MRINHHILIVHCLRAQSLPQFLPASSLGDGCLTTLHCARSTSTIPIVRVARARQGVRPPSLFKLLVFTNTHQLDGEVGRSLLRASTEHILIVRGPGAQRLSQPLRASIHSSTLPSREGGLTILHCALISPDYPRRAETRPFPSEHILIVRVARARQGRQAALSL
jgi:hypothetical protein